MNECSDPGRGRPLTRLIGAVRDHGAQGAVRVAANGMRWRGRRIRHRFRRLKSAYRRSPVRRLARTTKGRVRARARRIVRPIWARQPPWVRARVERLRRQVDVRRFTASELEPQPGSVVDSPEVAIVVAASNRADLVRVALRSLQLQSVESWECLVVDDGSLDDTMFAVQDFVAVDPRIRLVRHDSSLGASAARNTALAHVRAPWVCFLDDDDFLLADSLERRLDAVRDQPDDVAGAICDWLNVDPDAGLEHFTTRRSPTLRGQITYPRLVAGVPFIISSPLTRTSVIRSVGGFDEDLVRAEDADLWFRILRLGYRFVDAAHLGVAYRRSVGSLVTGDPAAQLDSMAEVFARAERPAPEIEAFGPMPMVGPLSAVALEMARLDQHLRYLALMAARDEDEAAARGRELLSPQVRRSLDPATLVRPLANHVAARLVDLDSDDVADLERRVERLLAALEPEVLEPSPPADDPRWVGRRGRGRAVGPMRSPDADSGDVAGAVVLIAEARYHVDELGPLADVLDARGVKVRFMSSPKTIPAVMRELAAYDHPVVPYSVEACRHAAAVVSLNDWGPIRQLMENIHEHGVPTFAKVEGVQDFDDDDTGRRRDAYRTASVILAQGPNDAAALPEKDTRIVGSTRLERIWSTEAVRPGDHALVNLNFTYGVLTDQRDLWVSTVASGLAAARVDGLVSRHPAERGDVHGMAVAGKPFRYEITRAGCLVSRFSTVPFEAMARGVPFVYHNPHGERVPTFRTPDGAYPITTTAEELASALPEILAMRGDYRSIAAPFFLRQIDVDASRSSEERTADVICDRI